MGPLGDVLTVDHFSWVSPLPPDLLIGRLEPLVTHTPTTTPVESAPLLGQVHDDSFRAQVRVRPTNAWAPVFSAAIESIESGSFIRCRLGATPGIRVFTQVWMGVAAILAAVIVIRVITSGQPAGLLTLIAPLGAVALPRYAGGIVTSQRQRLITLLTEALDARPAPRTDTRGT